MGIRYYAYSVAASQVETVRLDPRAYFVDPLADAWGLVPEGEGTWVMTDRPPPANMLYLDKCWRLLQRFCTSESGTTRPAHLLFRGDVIPRPGGYEWTAHTAVLTPDEVAAAAADLASVSEAELSAFCSRLDAEEVDYFHHHFTGSRTFTGQAAGRGSGLVYLIG